MSAYHAAKTFARALARLTKQSSKCLHEDGQCLIEGRLPGSVDNVHVLSVPNESQGLLVDEPLGPPWAAR